MVVKINIPWFLQRASNDVAVTEVQGDTVGDCLKRLVARFPLLEKELFTNPKAGIELGNNCFKLRLPNSSIPTGKRGGFRIVYYYRTRNIKIYLLDIYSKTELANISDKKLLEILKRNGLF